MNKKILVVDDDQDILEALQYILEDSGFTVQTARNGEEIYIKVATFKPDSIVLDVLLSGRDGRTICKNLKKREETKHIPVIMISAHPSASESVMKVGADDFIAKPFDVGDLLTTVRRHTPTSFV